MEQEAPFLGRNSLPQLLNARRLLGTAVEVGTHRGEYAREILQKWQGSMLYCVDPYKYEDSSITDPIGRRNEKERLDDKSRARRNLERFSGRFKFIEKTSMEAVNLFTDESLDFVYIDGCHCARHFSEDCFFWWPKVKSKGIFAGHDVRSSTQPGEGHDKVIRPIINWFADYYDLDVYIVRESNLRNWSFYIDKP